MEQLLRQRAEPIWTAAIRSVLPDEAVRRALEDFHPQGRVFLVAAGKAAWQMAHAALAVLGRVDGGIVITKYGHVRGPLPGVTCCEAGHPVPDDNSFAATQRALALVSGLRADDTVLFLLSGGGSALFEKPLLPAEELQAITQALLACGADIVEINTIRKRLSAVKGGRFALACAPAAVYSVVLSDILGDPLDMIASGPACPDSSTCAQAAAIAEKYRLALSPAAAALLRQETPKTLPNVTTKITGSVRELCRAAADACRAEGYEPVLLTDCLCCEAREAGSLLGSIARTHAGQGRRRAFIAGGETVVHLTGHGLGGRNQELALAAAPALAGLRGCCVFSVRQRRHRRSHRCRGRLRGRRSLSRAHCGGPGRVPCAGRQRRLPRLTGRWRSDHDRPHRHKRQRRGSCADGMTKSRPLKNAIHNFLLDGKAPPLSWRGSGGAFSISVCISIQRPRARRCPGCRGA